jgi:nicotinamide riboside kinase
MNLLKIIVIGPESSGKTTLCNALSKHFNLPFSKEYARDYLEKLNSNYTQDDLLKIAKGQLQTENGLQLLDTDLITLKIWSEYKYGSCDNWILTQIEKQKIENRFYLICKPDLTWQPDKQRQNPNDREALFKIYKQELNDLGHKYFIVKGEDRAENSISKISSITSLI